LFTSQRTSFAIRITPLFLVDTSLFSTLGLKITLAILGNKKKHPISEVTLTQRLGQIKPPI